MPTHSEENMTKKVATFVAPPLATSQETKVKNKS
jgi:hypothetical protein